LWRSPVKFSHHRDRAGNSSGKATMTQPIYGPHNPHPLSLLRTELVWEGKYDEYGTFGNDTSIRVAVEV
jgi:hypothetical protein